MTALFIFLVCFQQANKKNGNGRVYPPRALAREIENYKKIVRERRSYGELDHPDSSVVELKNSSHIVTEIKMDGEGVFWNAQAFKHSRWQNRPTDRYGRWFNGNLFPWSGFNSSRWRHYAC